MAQRLAIVTGLALFAGALLFSLIPASANGSDCGHWFSPEWDKAKSQELAGKYADLADEAAEIPGSDRMSSGIADQALDIAKTWRACDDSLTTRRNVSIGLLIAAGVVPVAILYVARESD